MVFKIEVRKVQHDLLSDGNFYAPDALHPVAILPGPSGRTQHSTRSVVVAAADCVYGNTILIMSRRHVNIGSFEPVEESSKT